MPHSKGTLLDIGLLDLRTGSRIKLCDQKVDGMDYSFLGFYEKFEDARSKDFMKWKKIVGEIFLKNNFKYGTKNEVWHFDYVG